jgi:3-oxoacyl-[acyl-carrier protein] reductase
MRQQKHNAEFYRLDLKREAEIRDLFDGVYAKSRRIDVLVNLAGGTLHKHPITEFPLSEWREVIDVNLKGTFLCCQAVIKPMKESKRGMIINTSSNFAITGSAERTAYSAAKAAVIAFTKSLALELAPYGVRQCHSARTDGYRAGNERPYRGAMASSRGNDSNGPGC